MLQVAADRCGQIPRQKRDRLMHQKAMRLAGKALLPVTEGTSLHELGFGEGRKREDGSLRVVMVLKSQV